MCFILQQGQYVLRSWLTKKTKTKTDQTEIFLRVLVNAHASVYRWVRVLINKEPFLHHVKFSEVVGGVKFRRAHTHVGTHT